MIKLDGKALAAKIKVRVREEAEKLPRRPGLAVVLVGEDPASRVYVTSKTVKNAGFTAMNMPCPPTPLKDSFWNW